MSVKTIQTDGRNTPFEQVREGDVFVRIVPDTGQLYKVLELKRDVPDLGVNALPQENGSAIQLFDEYNTAEAGSWQSTYGTKLGGVFLRTGQGGWVRTGGADFKYYSNEEVIKFVNDAGGFFPLVRGEKVEA